MSTWFVGSYTDDMGGDSTGIAVLESRADGTLHHSGYAAAVASPSYLLVTPTRVFAASEGAARVEAFTRDGLSLEHSGGDSAGGVSPCHLSLFGDTIVASCYGDGVLGMLDAEPVKLSATLGSEGSGPHAAQDGPHAHATFSPDGRTVFSADLGADRVHIHSVNDGVLVRTGSLELPAGTGPRDFRLHPSGAILLLGELSHDVLSLSWTDGVLAIVGSVAIPGAEASDHASEISLTADGRFAFAALRGTNRIASFAVSPDGVRLTPLAAVDCGGDWPRHHAVDGDVLHVANQRSSTVVSFRIGPDGALSRIGEPTVVASPTYLARADFDSPETLVK